MIETDFPVNASELPRRSLASAYAFRDRIDEEDATLKPGQEWGSVNAKYFVVCRANHECHVRASNVLRGQGVCGRCASGTDRAESRFYSRLNEEEGILKPGQKWQGAAAKYYVICRANHECYVEASYILKGGGVCGRCASGTDRAESRFYSRLDEEEATLKPGQEWKGVNAKYFVICRAGHECHVWASGVIRGDGVCLRCARGVDQAESQFYSRLAEEEATLKPGQEWKGTQAKYYVICRAGHECYVWANNVLRGNGVCVRCARGVDQAASRFYCRLDEEEATLKPGQEWRGANAKYYVTCRANHECYVLAASVLAGRGVCKRCGSGTDQTESQFYSRLAEEEATLKPGQEWKGRHSKYYVICRAGHRCHVWASDVISGQGICLRCARGVDQAASRFYSRLDEEEATLKPGQEWKGVNAKYYVTCRANHECYVWATSVLQGAGVCEQCHIIHTIVYVVTTPSGDVKFGITSGVDGKKRLRAHKNCGYTTVEFLATGLPLGMPRHTETAIKDALRDAGYRAENGWEYFASEARNLVLKVAREALSDEAIEEWRKSHPQNEDSIGLECEVVNA